MKVARCHDCPFYQVSILTLITTPPAGHCGYDVADERYVRQEGDTQAEFQERLRRRPLVIDRNAIPAACPLRSGDITITLVTN